MIELRTSEVTSSKQELLSEPSFARYDNEISYEEFFRSNLECNTPCIFGSWLTNSWLAKKEWVSSEGKPNIDFLSKEFGEALVPVADCGQKHYDSQKKEMFFLKDYVNYLENRRVKQVDNCLYLKDWHFVKAFPSYEAYIPTQYFASDWLNEFWELREDVHDDYRFVYIGPQGSWTPFHADVFRSYSWSANICGRKRWVFYPPGEEKNLRNNFGDLVYDIDCPDIRDPFHFPKASLAKGRLEIIQEEGEAIFVPSNWHHQVWNLEETISINHNWINATNISFVWDFLLSSLIDVEKAIDDCSEMEGWSDQCQLILKTTHGMDMKEYFQFLKVIAKKRIDFLSGKGHLRSFNVWEFGKNHVIYDVKKLIWCLESLLDEPHSDVLECMDDGDHPTALLDELQAVM